MTKQNLKSILIIIFSISFTFSLPHKNFLFIGSEPKLGYSIKEIVDYASLGYCSNEELYLVENKTLSLKSFRSPDWQYLGGHIFGDQFDFGYHIVYNDSLKKIVFSFSGTKRLLQLSKEFFNQNGIPQKYDRKVQLMGYFSNLLDYTGKYFTDHVSGLLSKLFANDSGKNTERHLTDYKFTFSGHSLGGSMAAIFLNELMLNKVIPFIEGFSPELLTLGQPRTGNYVFANELNKKVAKTMRIVQEGDGIMNLPNCYGTVGNDLPSNPDLCKNEFSQFELNANITEYDLNNYSESLFYPWHLGGLIINPYNTSYPEELIDCQGTSEDISKCNIENKQSFFSKWIYSITRHTRYFGVHISKNCRDSKNTN